MTEEERVRAENEKPISDEEAMAALCLSVRVVQEVMDMVGQAISAVDREDADEVFAARIKAQRVKDEYDGSAGGEGLVMRHHPLAPLWKLALRSAATLDKLLSVTNPKLFVARKRAELEVQRQHRQSAKLEAA